jgi:hypothetical protein
VATAVVTVASVMMSMMSGANTGDAQKRLQPGVIFPGIFLFREKDFFVCCETSFQESCISTS